MAETNIGIQFTDRSSNHGPILAPTGNAIATSNIHHHYYNTSELDRRLSHQSRVGKQNSNRRSSRPIRPRAPIQKWLGIVCGQRDENATIVYEVKNNSPFDWELDNHWIDPKSKNGGFSKERSSSFAKYNEGTLYATGSGYAVYKNQELNVTLTLLFENPFFGTNKIHAAFDVKYPRKLWKRKFKKHIATSMFNVVMNMAKLRDDYDDVHTSSFKVRNQGKNGLLSVTFSNNEGDPATGCYEINWEVQ